MKIRKYKNLATESLAIKNPKLAKEWHPTKNEKLTPYDVVCGSNKRVWWKCPLCGWEWAATVEKRSVRGDRCPHCARKHPRPGHSLADKRPDLISEWDYKKNYPLRPEDVYASSTKSVHWKCLCNHEFHTPPRNRNRGRNCPYCAGFLTPPEKSIFELRPDLLEIWDYDKNTIKPNEVSVSSGRTVHWKDKYNHEWEAIVANVSKGIGCPVCSGRVATPTDNIVVKRPDLMKEWDYEKNKGIDPYLLKPSSGKKVHWKDRYGHTWVASLNKRNHGRGCPHCHKYQVYDGEICDSLIEAFYYLKFKNEKIKFVHNKRYNNKRRFRFDFYLIDEDKYIEVTSFLEGRHKYGPIHYKEYIKKINTKEKMVKKLGSKFEFIQRNLKKSELKFVRKYVVKT